MAITDNSFKVVDTSTFETMEQDSMDQLEEWHRSAMATEFDMLPSAAGGGGRLAARYGNVVD